MIAKIGHVIDAVEQLKKLIEHLNIYDTSKSNYVLVFNGMELKDEFYKKLSSDELKLITNPLGAAPDTLVINHDGNQYTPLIGQGYTSFFTNTDTD